MASQFDAVARIDVDLRGFRSAAQQVTRSGGEMERVFRGLHSVLGRVELVEKNLARELSRSLRIYNQISQAARNYATAVAALEKNSTSAAQGTRLMENAFSQLGRVLSRVRGLGEREFERLQRTLTLYVQMTQALNSFARAQQAMASVSQNAQKAELAVNKERTRAAEVARRLALEEQKLQVNRERAATATRNAAAQETRAQAQLLRAQNQLITARDRDARAAERSARASRRAARGFDSLTESAFSLRSALTDLEQLYLSAQRQLINMGTAAVSTAIAHEAAFAQIERVTGLAGDELERMEKQFHTLAAQLPVDFVELTRVAQLASQTGVANEQLIEFTDTIVRFSVTTGVASEQATLMLARIMQMRGLPVAQLENLASAILALGISSASTENEILKVAESIATVTDLFGLSIQATTGLASALATLRVRPELSRGALTRVFAQLTLAASQAGREMDTLSRVMNLTADEMANLLETDADAFFLRFIQGMSGTVDQAGELRQTLADLSINAVRDIDVISRLANNYDLLAEQVQRSRVEFLLSNKLQEQSQTIFETTRVRIDNMVDAFQALVAQMTGPFATALGLIAEQVQHVLEFLSQFPAFTTTFGIIATTVGLGVSAWLAYRIAVAAAFRSVLALQQAQVQMRGTSLTLTGALRALSQVQAQTAATAGTAATATTAAATAQAAAARSTASLAAAQGAVAASTLGVVSGMRNASSATERQSAVMANQAALARNAGVSMTGLANVTSAYGAALVNPIRSQRDMANTTQVMNRTLTNATPIIQANQAALTGNAAAAASSASATAANAAANNAAATSAGRLASALAFLRRNWLAALGVAGLLVFAVTSLASVLGRQADAMRDASAEAINAVGGLDAYRTALVEDTQAAENAVGGIEGIEDSLRRTGEAATEAGAAYGTVRVATEELSGAIADKTRRDLEEIQNQQRAIELSKGSIQSLRERAEGQGVLADAARQSLADMEALIAQEENYKAALEDSTLVIGERLQALAEQQFQESLTASGLLESEEAFNRLQEAIRTTGFTLEDVFTEESPRALEDVQTQISELTAEYRELGRQASASIREGGATPESKREAREQRDLIGEQIEVYEFLEAVLLDNRDAFDEATRSASILTELGLDPLGEAAQSDAESLQALNEASEAYAARITELSESYTQLIDASTAWRGETEESVQSVNAFTRRLREQVEAQQDFAQNMAILASQGFTALVDQLRAAGPEGAEAAEQLVNATEEQLRELDTIARRAGEDFTDALARSMDRVAQLDVGTEAAQSISSGIVNHLNEISASGGDLQLATERIISVLDLIDQQQIEPEVALDILDAVDSLGQLQKIIDTAKKNGSLDADGEAFLDTLLYDTALDGLTDKINELEERNQLDAEGNASMTTEEYLEALNDIIESKNAAILEGLLDAEGSSDIDVEPYRDALENLKNLKDEAQGNGDFDPEGTPQFFSESFIESMERLRRLVEAKSEQDDFSPYGSPVLLMDNFLNNQLPRVEQAAWNTGAQITNALTRTATVSVVYSNVNSPPPRYMQAADGGWIRGPGGPRDDRIPALLSNKEFVVNAKSAREYGELLEAINSRRGVKKAISSLSATPQKFADGGEVGPRRLVSQMPPSGVLPRVRSSQRLEAGPVFNIHNTYPQAEPTSVSINRSLAYAATISGV